MDGDISYNDGSTVGSEESVSYYTVDSALDYNKVGSYPVTIRAVDKNANVSEKTFTVNVLAKKKTVKENDNCLIKRTSNCRYIECYSSGVFVSSDPDIVQGK